MIYNVFNKDLLIWCKEPQFKSQHIELAPLPDIINEKEEYEVEKIRKYQKQRCGTQFLVYWKGYGNEHDQWIAEMGLPHGKEMIEDY